MRVRRNAMTMPRDALPATIWMYAERLHTLQFLAVHAARMWEFATSNIGQTLLLLAIFGVALSIYFRLRAIAPRSTKAIAPRRKRRASSTRAGRPAAPTRIRRA